MCLPRGNTQTITFTYPLHHHIQEHVQPQRPWRLKPAHKGFILWHVLAVAYYLTNSFCFGQCMQDDGGFALVDLSHTFNNETIYWGNEPKLNMNVTFNGTVLEKGYWFQKEQISGFTHGGTHMDAPCHFSKGKWCVSDIPLEHLVVPAVVVNITRHVGDNPNVHLTADHLLDWEKEFGQIPKGSLLLIHTGWSQFWPDPLKYSGSSDRNVKEFKFPAIDGTAAKWIAQNRDIVGIGIDSMSVEVPNIGFPVTHVTLYEKNIYGLENVNNLHLLPPTGAVVSVMPMKLEGASGAPCRIFAQLRNDMTSAATLCNAFCCNVNYIAAVFVFMMFLM